MAELDKARRAIACGVVATLQDVVEFPKGRKEFATRAASDNSIKSAFVALEMGISAQELLAERRCVGACTSTLRRARAKRDHKGFDGRSGHGWVVLPPIKQVRRHSMIDVLIMFGDPIALELALSTPGVGGRAWVEPDAVDRTGVRIDAAADAACAAAILLAREALEIGEVSGAEAASKPKRSL